MLGQQLDERAAGCPARVPAWAPMQPRAGQLQLAEQGAEDDGLVIFEATASAAGWAGRARGQERGDLAAEDLALELQQERLGLGQRQAQVLRPVVLLVQHNELVDGDLLVVLGDDHELKLEAQRHAGDPQRWKDPATVSARARQPEASAPGLLWPRLSIAYGTDLLGGMHAFQSREFTIRAEVQQPADIVRAATTVAARVVQMEGKIGVVAPGAF